MTDYLLLLALVGLAIFAGWVFRSIRSSGRSQTMMSREQFRSELFPDTEEANMYKGEGRRSKARSGAIYH
jgi:hypothetical protein